MPSAYVRCIKRSQKLLASTYVLTVAAVAAAGFVRDSTPTILLAAALSLPASMAAVPGYYAVYGLLALVPGANPSESSGGWSSCTADGDCISYKSGDPAAWFQVATTALGVLALTCAALLNVLALYVVTRRKPATRRGQMT